MDDALIRFREAADRENGRRPLRRRYSLVLQQQAVEYWRQRRREDGVRTIAASLGVSVTTLQRWTRTPGRRTGFRPIAVLTPRSRVRSRQSPSASRPRGRASRA